MNGKPSYEWDVAEVGDTAPTKTVEVDGARVKQYVDASGDANPLYMDEAFARAHGFDGIALPVSMTIRVAPPRRGEIMKTKGYEHPVRPTPFARWQAQYFAPMKPGEKITSDVRLSEKFEKRGRKYLVWEIVGRNEAGEKVVEYRCTHSWEGAKPEDRTR